MPTAKLVSITPNYMELLKLACSKPYGKNVNEKGIRRIIESGHLSVLEHCYASFEVECSVRVLGQLTRHRHLSFTVKSARGSRFDKLLLPLQDRVIEVPADACLSFQGYLNQLKKGVSEEDAAYLMPQGAKTSMVVTGNFRAWYEYLPKRLCNRAMPEHRMLAEAILKELAAAAPEVFKNVHKDCGRCKERSCDFK